MLVFVVLAILKFIGFPRVAFWVKIVAGLLVLALSQVQAKASVAYFYIHPLLLLLQDAYLLFGISKINVRLLTDR